MSFDPTVYPAPVPDLLAAPPALNPAAARRRDPALRPLVEQAAALPPEARAGLWLLAGYWDESHSVAQDCASPEGSYWHALLHRLEPDAWNSNYWFGRIGRHAIFPALAREAASLGYGRGGSWDPAAFTAAWESERDPVRVRLYEAVQLAEWRLLFAHSMKGNA